MGYNKIKKILITGGAGFIGSHAAEYYAQKGDDVIVFDNLSRAKLLKKDDKNYMYNWNYLKLYKNVKSINVSIVDLEKITKDAKDVDAIIHTAAQTAVTSSVKDPEEDFKTNALGTFNVLEAARKNDVKSIVYCSTNKVYGNNVNKVEVKEEETRYSFKDQFKFGIPESFSIDLCKHTPYGCSKLCGDLYVQDYAHLYGMKTAVFRMSCIYGTRQFGVEDQGWVAWFAIATMLDKPITIYGDGKQVRDILYVSDLINLFDKFINSKSQGLVCNVGGGPSNTLSLLELLEFLQKITGKKSKINFSEWRPSDQKVYISDICKAKKVLGWEVRVNPTEGISKLVQWIKENRGIL